MKGTSVEILTADDLATQMLACRRMLDQAKTSLEAAETELRNRPTPRSREESDAYEARQSDLRSARKLLADSVSEWRHAKAALRRENATEEDVSEANDHFRVAVNCYQQAADVLNVVHGRPVPTPPAKDETSVDEQPPVAERRPWPPAPAEQPVPEFTILPPPSPAKAKSGERPLSDSERIARLEKQVVSLMKAVHDLLQWREDGIKFSDTSFSKEKQRRRGRDEDSSNTD